MTLIVDFMRGGVLPVRKAIYHVITILQMVQMIRIDIFCRVVPVDMPKCRTESRHDLGNEKDNAGGNHTQDK